MHVYSLAFKVHIKWKVQNSNTDSCISTQNSYDFPIRFYLNFYSNQLVKIWQWLSKSINLKYSTAELMWECLSPVVRFMLSLNHYMAKKIYCFGVELLKCRFWWIYTLWVPFNPKILFLEQVGFVCEIVCLCVSFWLSMYVCVSIISIIQSQITAETSNLAFYFFYHMLILLE